MAAPSPLACVEPKLARFVRQQPKSSTANYLYAMSILKHHEQPADKQASQQVEALLTKAVTLDPKCSEAYLQLGIIAASQRNFDKAIGLYSKAIEADPQLADAHYRLGVAYDRTGQPTKAKQELQLHDRIKQQQAQETERQRREIKQFIIGQPEEPAHSETKKLRLN
jgi:tetratricopeptide (TPR) repeat protein